MDLRPLTQHDILSWADLLACCFDQSPIDMQHLIRWLYCLGDMEAYGLWDNDQLIAQYSCLHRNLRFESQSIPIGMSMNMAVHPDYRGQGLIKQVSQPVYEMLEAKQIVLGMGFSNAQGVKVDKYSKSYGYQVIGQMQPLVIKTKDFHQPPLTPLDIMPSPFYVRPNRLIYDVHFCKDTHHLIQRYLQHPFRQYKYSIWHDDGDIYGIVVYKDVRLWGVPAVALLDVYGDFPEDLLMRWSSTLYQQNIKLIHTLVSPKSSIKHILKKHWLTIPAPLTRNPYYLTIKPLANCMDKRWLDFERWDLIGGDIL